MTIADTARDLAAHCEAKKDKLRQTQSGDWALGFTVAKGDLPAVVRDASPGQRFMLALVPIDDDELPIGGEDGPAAADIHPTDSDAAPAAAAPASPRRRWSDLSRAQRAGMLCEDAEFQRWVESTGWKLGKLDRSKACASAVRSECSVMSRTAFDIPGSEAAARWDALEARFMQATGRMAVDR